MGTWTTEGGVAYDRRALDRTEARFWREIWESVPDAVAAEHAVELARFGPLQATLVGGLPQNGMLNLVLGATAPGAVTGGHLGAAAEHLGAGAVTGYVPVTPDLPESAAAESWLAENGFAPGYGWTKFLRDAHPPRFRVDDDVEVDELSDPEAAPFGTIAAVGFGLPAWAADLFASLPGRPDWRCYVARIDGEAAGCGAMLLDGEIAELGFGATLAAARGRGCQLALLRRRIEDAAAADARLLFAETGERAEGRPATSYRNLLRAGFEAAYVTPNWTRAPSGGAGPAPS